MTDQTDFWSAYSMPGAVPANGGGASNDFWSAYSTPVGTAPNDPTLGEVASDVAKSSGIGLAKGTIGIPGMVGDARNLGAHLSHWLVDKVTGKTTPFVDPVALMQQYPMLRALPGFSGLMEAPTSGDIQNAVEGVTGKFYEPKTKEGRFAQTVAEIVPSAALGTEFATPEAEGAWDTIKAIGGDTRRLVVPSVVAAGGGEAADALGLPKWVGQTVGFAAAKAPEYFSSNAGKLVNDRLGDITDDELNAARALEARGRAVGIPLMGQESLNNLGLTQLAGDVAASPTGSGTINNFLTQRTPQIQAARQTMLDTIAPEAGPQVAGDTIQATADQRLRDLGRMASDVATPSYTAAKAASIPDTEVMRLETNARAAAAQAGAGTLARQRLIALADSIRDNGGNIGLLDSTRRTFRDNLSNAALPEAADSETRQLMNPVLNDLRDTMANHSPDFARGLQLSREAKTNIVQPVENSPVGQVLARTPEPTTQMAAFSPARMNGAEVRDTLNELALANPNAPSMATRLFARNETNFPATPTAGARIANSLTGRPDTAENFQAMMRGSEFANGQAPGTISGPVNDILNVMDATRRSPVINSATAGRNLTNELAASTPMTGFLETDIARPLGAFGDWLKNATRRRTYSTLAEALTAPNSVDELLALARRQGTTPLGTMGPTGRIMAGALPMAIYQSQGGQ